MNKELNDSFLVSGYFCYLLITFEISLDPDQIRQNVGPDQDSNCATPLCDSKRIFRKF